MKKNKIFYKLLDMALALSLATFAVMSIQDVIISFGLNPWYQGVATIAGLLVIVYAMARYTLYPFRLLHAAKIARIQEQVIESGMAHQSMLEDGIYQAVKLFTDEQTEQYYANLKEGEPNEEKN